MVTHGKGHHAHVVGFQLDFSEALNATAAQDPANYTVVRQTKHGRKLIARPLAFRAVYNAEGDSVQLMLSGRAKFARGGQIVVNPNSSGAIADVFASRLAAANGGEPVPTTRIVILRRAHGLMGQGG